MAAGRKKAGASVQRDAGEGRIERVRADGERLVEELERLYDQWLPPGTRQVNWGEYFAKGRSTKMLEEAATVASEIREIDKLTAEVTQTPLKIIKKAAGRIVDLCAQGGTSMVTPKFDSRIFKAWGLHTPAVNECVYTISANGSPLADSDDVFITVPVEGGESICLTASDLTKKNLLHLNPEAQGNMKKLSVRHTQACSSAKGH